MTNKVIQSEVQSLYLSELGITEANEIDLEAIAYYTNAKIKKEILIGCEARIIGVNERAIITVNANSSPERQRFSIGHELGHWFKDKGKVSGFCSQSDIHNHSSKHTPHREVIANGFASELLLPSYLLKETLKDAPLNLDTVRSVSDEYKTSMIVALQKIIEISDHLGFFAIYDKHQKRKRFKAHKELPYEFLPPQDAPSGSIVSEVISKNLTGTQTATVDGEVWCKTNHANDAVVHEEAFHYFDGQFITLVWWEDEEPIWNSMH